MGQSRKGASKSRDATWRKPPGPRSECGRRGAIPARRRTRGGPSNACEMLKVAQIWAHKVKRRLKAQSIQPPQFNDSEIDKGSGRKDSNLRPPGPEPGDSHFAGFCTAMRIFHIGPVQLVSSMGCAPTALHAYALSWRLWLHEKGTKRARFAGRQNSFRVIIPILLVSAGLSS
jgi:hypothetical protein